MNGRMIHRSLVVFVMLALGLVMAACNAPLAENPQDAFGTAAAQTVSAQLTQAFAVTPTVPVVPPTATLEPPTLPPPPPTATQPPPPPSATPGCTDVSTFVSDVTIPDNTNKNAGDDFTKTWRLRNSGTCTWTSDYDIVFVSGDAMGADASDNLPGNVSPGSTVDVSMDMTAPSSNGTFKGNWRLRNDDGVLFGVTFYVQIVVGQDVHKADKMTVDSSYYFDLDEGDPDASGGARDAWYHGVSIDEQYIEPMNGAKFKKWGGGGTPSYDDCKDASLSGNAINFDDIPEGTILCYKTSEGRYGRMQIDDKTDTTVRIDFRTWEE